MAFNLPPLPYDREALAPHISGETLDFHHGKHHAAYVNKLNAIIGDSGLQGGTLEDVVLKAEGGLFNQAAQHWNHAFYWQCLSPQGGGDPAGAVGEAIRSQWGSVETFKAEFEKTSLGTFGSGWVWLVQKDDELAIVSTKDAGNPMTDGARPLLTCDVWEHAYYIDYRNDRGKYVGGYWNLVNWDFATANMGEAWTIAKAEAGSAGA